MASALLIAHLSLWQTAHCRQAHAGSVPAGSVVAGHARVIDGDTVEVADVRINAYAARAVTLGAHG